MKVNLLSEQELVNLESLTAIYNSLKENETKPFEAVARLGFVTTQATYSSAVDNEKGFVSEIRDMILTRIATLVDCDCENELEEGIPTSVQQDEQVEYLTTDDIKDFLKINSKANVQNTDWEEGQYLYWDKDLKEFMLEDGTIFTSELEQHYDNTDKWVVL